MYKDHHPPLSLSTGVTWLRLPLYSCDDSVYLSTAVIWLSLFFYNCDDPVNFSTTMIWLSLPFYSCDVIQFTFQQMTQFTFLQLWWLSLPFYSCHMTQFTFLQLSYGSVYLSTAVIWLVYFSTTVIWLSLFFYSCDMTQFTFLQLSYDSIYLSTAVIWLSLCPGSWSEGSSISCRFSSWTVLKHPNSISACLEVIERSSFTSVREVSWLWISSSVAATLFGNSVSWRRRHRLRRWSPIWLVLAENFSMAWNSKQNYHNKHLSSCQEEKQRW